LIAVIEDVWTACGLEPHQWDVEFYGDFLMFHIPTPSDVVFFNTREFANDNVVQIMPYVGVSLLRNGIHLDDARIAQMLELFYPQFPALKEEGWRRTAAALYQSSTRPFALAREDYYTALADAEELRESGHVDNHAATLKLYLLLAKANTFRHENYILPSTVIHVVRTIQVHSPKVKQEDSRCLPYSVRLASCSLGPFAYLCSGLEQLGYALHAADSGDCKRFDKYIDRLFNAIGHFGYDLDEFTREMGAILECNTAFVEKGRKGGRRAARTYKRLKRRKRRTRRSKSKARK
jgi:hypothetical protein